MLAEGYDDRLALGREHGGARLLWPGWQVGDRAAAVPFGDGLLVDAVVLGQAPQAFLTTL